MKKSINPEQKAKKLAAQKRYREKNKEVLKEKSIKWAKDNPEKVKEIQKRYAESNKDKLIQRWKDEWIDRKSRRTQEQIAAAEIRRQKWKSENPDKVKESSRTWAKNNPDKRSIWPSEKRNAVTAKRRAKKLSATPSWFQELDDFVLKEAYLLAKLREKTTGMKWHVDHIIPLQGKDVCGLHCWNNVQVIPAAINLSKGNSFQGV